MKMKTTVIRQVRRYEDGSWKCPWDTYVNGEPVPYICFAGLRKHLGLPEKVNHYAPECGFELRVTAKLIKKPRARRAGGRKA